MTERQHHRGSLERLRDFSGSLRRPHHAEYEHLLRDDGHLDREEQVRIMAQLLPEQNRKMVIRFGLMLTLSVTIAVMGLAADSVAVVIGAMLIAPLMTPLMTFAAAGGLGLGRRAAQAAFLVVAGSIWSVLFAVVLARLLPEVTIGAEILGRTSPDVRDLVVAIAAGAAGAYATAREDISGALPGVAVAVALVPPLAATGVLIEADRMVLAEGAALLYVTNLLAIVVSALVVLLATGVIPTIRLAFRSSRVALTMAGILVATALITVPLTSRSLAAAESSRQRTDISTQVEQWLGGRTLDVNGLTVVGATVSVELAGLDEPPPAFTLATQLVPILGEAAEVVVRWDQRAQGVARADAPPAADPTLVARSVIEEWLIQLETDGQSFDLLDVTLSGDRVDVEVGGASTPPPSPSLPDQMASALGRPVDLTIRWIQQIDPGDTGERPQERLERFVRAWIGPRSTVRLVAVSIDGSTVTIDLAADGTPLGLTALREIADRAVGGASGVEIRTLPLVVVEPIDDVPVAPLLD